MAEGTIKIKEMEELTELTDNDYFVVDNLQSGVPTKKYKATRVIQMIENVADEIEEKITPSIDTALAVGSASGDIATFSDGSALPMPKLEIAVEPQQDLHGYDAPWVGGAGKNKFPIATATSSGTQNIFSKQPLSLSAGSYVLSFNSATPTTNNMSISFFNGDTQVRGSDITPGTTTVNFTFDQNITSVTWYVREAVSLSNIMIESGSTATTFAPYSNECPIIGWDEVNVRVVGKNLFGGAYNEYFPIHFNEDKVVIASADVPSEGTNPVQIAYYDKNKTLIDYWGLSTQYSAINNRVARSFTLPKESYYLRYITQPSANYQIEFGETNSAYEPYDGSTITIQLGDTYYGCKLDVVSGVLTVDRAYVNMGDLNYTYNNGFFRTSKLTSTIKKPSDNLTKVNAISSIYVAETWNAISNTDNGKFAVSSSNGEMIICNLAYSSASDFKTAMNGVQLVYELATPTTIQLTPTQVNSLLGSNNVWADTGKIIDCEYKRDATAIINSLIARIEALENQ